MGFFRKYVLLLALPLAFLAGCSDDTDPAGPYTFTWTEVRTNGTTAVVRAFYTIDVTPDPTEEAGILYTQKGGPEVVEVKALERSGVSFTTVVSGLKPNTEYTLSAYVKTAGGTKYISSSQRTVKTSEDSGELDADVEMSAPSAVSQNGAGLNAYYIIRGSGNQPSSAGFKYRKDGDASWNEVTCQSAANPLHYTLEGLEIGTKYYATAWIVVDGTRFDSSQGSAVSFTTWGDFHVGVQMSGVTGVTETGATFNADYTVIGSAVPVSSAGFRYRKEGSSSWTSVTSSSNGTSFKYTVSGLTSDTKYYVTSWVDHDGTRYESSADEASEFTTGSGGSVVPAGGWAELPVMKDIDYVIYNTSYFTHNGKKIRNYTICYDTKEYVAYWAAYPMHAFYTTKGTSRTDKWQYNPTISENLQPNLSGGYSVGSYSRGHQVGSSDRLVSKAANYQTFYYTNMLPQKQVFNGGIWNHLERLIQTAENGNKGGWLCTDTLYVVTGGAFIGNYNYTKDNPSVKSVAIPTHFYKVLVRSKTGTTGKAITELDESQIQCMGFWFSHDASYATDSKITSSYMCSIKDIEEKTGFTFFPFLSDAKKSTKTVSDWPVNIK